MRDRILLLMVSLLAAVVARWTCRRLTKIATLDAFRANLASPRPLVSELAEVVDKMKAF